MKRPEYVDEVGPPLSPENLDAAGNQLGVTLPADLRNFLLTCNGGTTSYKVNATFRSGKIRFAIRGFCGLGVSDAEDLVWLAEVLSDRLDRHEYLPLAHDWGGNFLVMGTRSSSIYFWDHEGGPPVKIASSLGDLLAGVKVEPSELVESEFEILCQTASLAEMKARRSFSSERKTLCQEAARQGNLRLVRECIEAGLPEGKVMRFAAMCGQWEILDYLIGTGRDINAPQENGRTILDWTEWKPEYHAEVARRGGVSSGSL